MDRLPDDELLSAYLDDELSADERAYVEQMLAERPEARRLLDELRGVRESLQSLPSYKLEPDFNAQVLQRAEREVLQAPQVNRIIRAGDELADRSITEAWYKEKRWRRPLLWSIVAVAAAVVLMFVDRTPQREGQLAQHAPKPVDSSAAPVIAAAPAAPATPSPPPPVVAHAKDGGLFGMRNSTVPMPSGVAGQGVEPNRDLDRPAVGALMLQGGNLAGGGATAVEGASTMQLPAAQVDMTPLVAENDYLRAESLIADYHDVRRSVTDKQAATRAFAGRVQQQAMEDRLQAKSSTSSEAPLIVSCVVPSMDAVERGLEPVLRQQQIADLTPIRESQNDNGFGAAAEVRQNVSAEVAQSRKRVTSGGEQYVYVVAERRQLEATLAEMRRRSDLFNEVNVEPTATTIASPVPAAAVAGASSYAPTPTPTATLAPASTPAAIAKSAKSASDQTGVDNKVELQTATTPESAAQSPPADNLSLGLDNVRQQAAAPISQYSYAAGQLTPLSRSQRISSVVAETEAVPREIAASRQAGEKKQAKKADASASATTAAPAAATPVNQPAPAAKAEAKNAAPANESLDRRRDEAEGASTPVDRLSATTQQLRNAYAVQLPPDYQEALFIFRVAAPVAKPQATGKSQ